MYQCLPDIYKLIVSVPLFIKCLLNRFNVFVIKTFDVPSIDFYAYFVFLSVSKHTSMLKSTVQLNDGQLPKNIIHQLQRKHHYISYSVTSWTKEQYS